MNPWDAELVIENGAGLGTEDDRWLYAGADAEIANVMAEAPGGADRWAKFFQAAPKMVRALLICGRRGIDAGGARRWHTHACWQTLIGPCIKECEAVRAALTAAGVPIP
jgi:hypothetical protein